MNDFKGCNALRFLVIAMSLAVAGCATVMLPVSELTISRDDVSAFSRVEKGVFAQNIRVSDADNPKANLAHAMVLSLKSLGMYAESGRFLIKFPEETEAEKQPKIDTPIACVACWATVNRHFDVIDLESGKTIFSGRFEARGEAQPGEAFAGADRVRFAIQRAESDIARQLISEILRLQDSIGQQI